MKASPFGILVFILILHQQRCNANNKVWNDGNENFEIIGLYSVCQNRIEKTEINKIAFMYHETAIKLFNITKCLDYNYCKHQEPDNYQKPTYIYHDVCDNLEYLTNVVVELLLNDKHHDKHGRKKLENQAGEKIILATMTHELIKFLATFLSGFNIYVLFLGDVEEMNDLLFQPSNFWRERDEVLHSFRTLGLMIKFYNWKSIGIIQLNRPPEDDVYNILCHKFIFYLKETNEICFFYESVDFDDVSRRKIVTEKLFGSHVEVVFLFGLRKDQYIFLKEYIKRPNFGTEVIWILQDVDTFIELKYYISFNSHERTRFHYYRKLYYNLPSTKNLMIKAKAVSEDMHLRQKRIITYFGIFKICYDNGKTVIKISNAFTCMTSFRKIGIMIKSDREFDKFRVNLEERRIFSFKQFAPYFPHTSVCTAYICKQGWEPKFGQMPKHQHNWNYSFGKTCRQCQPNTIKPTSGNTKCIPCLEHHLNNANHSTCYDPMKDIVLVASAMESKICLVFSVIGIFIATTLSIIILKNKDTPISKALDVKITLFHILIISMLYLFYPILFLVYPTWQICIIQPIGIGLLYSLNIGSIFVRSHKLLTIFSGKKIFRRVDDKRKILTMLQQVCLVLIFIGISFCGFCIAYTMKKTEVVTVIDFKVFERGRVCNTNFHTNAIVVSFILGHFLCIIPAYRGRNLPSVFKEAMMVVYISFTCIVSFGIMYPINLFQRRLEHKICLQWIIFHVNTIVVLLILYGSKCFVMIFQPHKNSKDYVTSRLRPSYLR